MCEAERAMKCESCDHENVEGARFCAKCGAAVPVHVIGQTDPLIGQVIGGRFHVTGVLGEGGMGIVYVGEQQMGTTVRKVAVKTLHAHLSKDSSIMARFHREVGTVAQLEHPNTIKVYDFGTTKDGALYIAMEFVSGQSLADVIAKDGAMPADRVTHIMRQICGALDEAHQQGIVHRDLKPENIILTQRAGETDFVKVLDFGIAARTESADAQKEAKLTQQGMVLGTPPYMSPEQFTGKQLDARSDVYSLGVMAYEMITGHLPFEAETPWEWATQHMTVNPKPFEVAAPGRYIPEALTQAILKSLSKERTQRQDSARQFFAELSGGARMTVEAGALQHGEAGAAPGYQATAAMPQAQSPIASAASGYGATAVQPQVAAPMSGVGMGAAVSAVGTPAYGAVPIPPPRKANGSNKGLIFGLGGVGLVLVVAIIIVVIRSNQPDDTGPLTAPTTGAALIPAVVTGESPQVESPTTPGGTTPSQLVAMNPGKTPTAGVKTGTAGKTATGTATATSTATTTAATTTTAANTGAQTATATATATASNPPAGANAACGQCVSAAQNGNFAAVVTAFQGCMDATEKAKCRSTVAGAAPAAVKRAAFNGQCTQAEAIIAAARQVGANSPSLTRDFNKSSCAKR
jgi:serine/threonine-protein kinase